MIKFLSAVMLTMTFLFVAPKAKAYQVPVYGSVMTQWGLVTWSGWIDGLHGHVLVDVAGIITPHDWIVINPHTGNDGNINYLDHYTTFNDFTANNTITGGDYSNPNLFLAVYNDLATHFDAGDFTQGN